MYMYSHRNIPCSISCDWNSNTGYIASSWSPYTLNYNTESDVLQPIATINILCSRHGLQGSEGCFSGRFCIGGLHWKNRSIPVGTYAHKRLAIQRCYYCKLQPIPLIVSLTSKRVGGVLSSTVGIFILNDFTSSMPWIFSLQSGESCNDLVYDIVSMILGG